MITEEQLKDYCIKIIREKDKLTEEVLYEWLSLIYQMGVVDARLQYSQKLLKDL